ncbi:MAG: hypothetical protein JW797_07845 [Bradymonadales bacterium]|nr:hypothetical protein [Bradymonadales bacterium]
MPVRHIVAVIAWLAVLGAGPCWVGALPPNTHPVPEGYWIGGAPVTTADIEDLHRRGVRVVVSGVVMAEEPRQACRRLGIERVNVWFGRNFPSVETLMSGTEHFQPSEIFIHCDHGGDRAGALLAFFLAVRHGWRADHAILAVAYPGRRDVERLIALLEAQGLQITPEEQEQYLGIYSGAQNGGSGGLKIRGEDYRTLVITTLQAMASFGIEVTDPIEPAREDPAGSVAGEPCTVASTDAPAQPEPAPMEEPAINPPSELP